MDEPNLFSFVDAQVTENREGMVEANPRMTSARAARRVEPRTGTQRGRVLTAIVEHGGLSDFEIAEECGLLENSCRPRRTELISDGYVEDSGRIRRHRGSDWVVWQATAAGRAWWTRNVSNAA